MQDSNQINITWLSIHCKTHKCYSHDNCVCLSEQMNIYIGFSRLDPDDESFYDYTDVITIRLDIPEYQQIEDNGMKYVVSPFQFETRLGHYDLEIVMT